jgi:hypothetical protein
VEDSASAVAERGTDDAPPPADGPADAPTAGEAAPVQTAGASPLAPAPDAAPPSRAAPQTPLALTWAAFRDARFGFSLAYPSDVFASDPTRSDEGTVFASRDGRARLVVFARAADGLTLAAYRRSLMTGPYKGAVLDYAPKRDHWFVLSGMLGEEMIYERVTFSCEGRTLHSWKLAYPMAERPLYDRIVEAMHRRYRHSNGPGARCEAAAQTSRSE